MQVKLSESFKQKFKAILVHIAKDKMSASRSFQKEILKLLKHLPEFPYIYRKSFYFDDQNIRDMTYKGYTIIYEVHLEDNSIEILDIFNQNKPLSCIN